MELLSTLRQDLEVKALRLTEAPILEAVLAFSFAEELPENTLDQLAELFPEYKWQKLDINRLSSTFKFEIGKGEVETKLEHLDFQFRADALDKESSLNRTLFLQKGQFSFHWKEKYSNWDTFVEIAYSHWHRIADKWGLELAFNSTRFVNSINLNLTIDEYKHRSKVSNVLKHTGYTEFNQYLVEGRSNVAHVHLGFIQNNELDSDPTKGSLYLDISVDGFRPQAEGKPYANLEELQAIKNNLFFNMVSEKALKQC